MRTFDMLLSMLVTRTAAIVMIYKKIQMLEF
jgi:hypothetical protein